MQYFTRLRDERSALSRLEDIIGSEVRNSADDFNTHGIVDINLTSTGYSGRFVPAPGFGSFTDSFSGTCGRT